MAALNYSVNFTDTGNTGSGPYTITILKNPTAASGGTDISARAGTYGVQGGNIAANGLGTLNPQELAAYAAHVIGDDIAAANQNDPLN